MLMDVALFASTESREQLIIDLSPSVIHSETNNTSPPLQARYLQTTAYHMATQYPPTFTGYIRDILKNAWILLNYSNITP
ncbi:hypothetical protein XFUD_05280 [Xylella fastidiosa]|nr:hypothetical protein XFUD_05280 [Xylella fastidiosa]